MLDQFILPDDSSELEVNDDWLRDRYHVYIRTLMHVKAEMAMDPRVNKITVHRHDPETGDFRFTVTYVVNNVKYAMNGQAATAMETLARCRQALDKKLDALHRKTAAREERRSGGNTGT